jgi:hypothetical protein
MVHNPRSYRQVQNQGRIIVFSWYKLLLRLYFYYIVLDMAAHCKDKMAKI